MQKKIIFLVSVLTLLMAAAAFAQITASIKGTVTDPSGAAVAGAKVTVTSPAIGLGRTTTTNGSGDYEVPALPPGVYTVKVERDGFQAQQAQNVMLEVSQNTVQNFGLKVATASEVITVEGVSSVVETTTMTVGQTIDKNTVQEIPLNGRHFVDLALLIPGSVTPPQNGFLTAPLRGQGSFAVNTAGNREDAVNWMINGINLNDMVQNQVTFQPTINTVSEFKVDNSTYSAEYGRNSGAIVNIATRTGTNQFHGEMYEYVRNEWLDARNAFNRVTTSSGAPNPISPFKRNQFGGDFGGPIWKDKTFFFVSYEGTRHRQGLTLTSNVFPDSSPSPCATVVTRACIAAAGQPVANALLGLIPHANTTVGSSPVANAFTGSATAPVNIDQGTADIDHNFSDADRLHGYYVYQHDLRQEPGATGGTNLPNFGDTREGHRQVFTLNETHVFSSNVINELNLGANRILITFTPNNNTSPSSLGLSTALGPNEQLMPTISISDQGMLFGDERNFPQGRGDVTAVIGDTLSYIVGRHSFKFGTEFRDFRNNNFNNDPGQLVYNTSAHFSSDAVDSAARTIGKVANRINQNSLDFFVQDSFKWKPYFTLELGLRYAWNMTPSEGANRFVNFVPAAGTGSMLVATTEPYQQNNKKFQPRLGFAWDLFHDGKTVLRAGYAYQVDEPVTGIVTGLTSNPPFALPISVNGASPSTPLPLSTLSTKFNGTPASVAPFFVNPNFTDANVQSWNLNIQQQFTRTASVMVGYFGSKGTHLEIDRNVNQFTVLGTAASRPFVSLSPNSPFLPGVTLANNITERDSSSNSNYHALWVSATQRLSHGLQFNASYTWSHSIDEVSRNNQGIIVQDSGNIFSSRGNSDFDARQRFVLSAIYELPWAKNNRFLGGWELAPIVSLQSGNPFNVVVASPSITGAGNTVHPNASAPVQVSGNPLGQWIANPGVLSAPGNAFGKLGRNVLVGPDFKNLDLSLAKNTKLTERLKLQLRCDAFDLFNHPNYGQPIPQAGGASSLVFSSSPSFSTITSTRAPTGDSGSSRQLQLAAKLIF